MSTVVESVAREEAEAAREAVRFLTDERVEFALAGAAEALRARARTCSMRTRPTAPRQRTGSTQVARPPAAHAGSGSTTLGRQLLVVAELPPLERVIE